MKNTIRNLGLMLVMFAVSCMQPDYSIVTGGDGETVYVEVPGETEYVEVPTYILVEVPGETQYGEIWVDSFVQPQSVDGVDILWVIDTSGSMYRYDPELMAGIEAMLEALPESGWRLAMMSNDPTKAAVEAQFPLVPGDDVADAIDMYNNMGRGGREEGFDAAYEYIVNNSYASTWLRPDAALLVVFVSDEEEQSDDHFTNIDDFKSNNQELGSLDPILTGIVGSASNDNLVGTSDNDTIHGLQGNDTIDGGLGIDIMNGGPGNDIYLTDDVNDVVNENTGEGTDTIQSSVTFTLSSNIENLTLTGSSNINATGNLIIAKDYLGQAYLPEWNFNGIGDMNPGEGYQLKTINADVLQYLPNNQSYRMSTLEVTENHVSHFAKVVPTDNNMTVVIEDAAWDVLPSEGAEIAAFDKDGHQVGSAIYSSPVTVLAVWGDDATTSSKDGLAVSEVVSFKVWNTNDVRDFTVSKWIEGASSYQVDAINIASSIETHTIMTELDASERLLVRVINVLGQEVNMDDEPFKGTVLFKIYDDGSVERFVE